MIFYVLVLAVVLNGQTMTAFHSTDGKNPHQFKSKEACDEARKEADEVLGPELTAQGASYMIQCITSEQAAKMMGKEGA